jgi:RES domain-containing protein
LEVCVHTAGADTPPDFTLLKIEGPAAKVRLVETSALPTGWQESLGITREIGAAWLRERDTVLMRVPSAIVPHTFNLLLNPLHPEAKMFRIAETFTYPFDRRIKE